MLKEFLNTNFLDKSPSDYALFAGIFAGSLLILHIGKILISRRIKKARERAGLSIDHPVSLQIEKRIAPMLYCIAIYLSVQVLTLGASLDKIVNVLFLIALGFFTIRLVVLLLNLFVERRWVLKEEDPSKLQTIRGIAAVAKIAVWALAVFLLLDNLGVNISSLLAGLGIGGIAIALAAQTILGDLFSAFVIYFDRPFEVGDFIAIDNFSGAIEHIGIKTTRIRSLSGEEMVFSNTDLTKSRLRNYKRMNQRRVNFKIGVTYDTKVDNLKAIPDLIAGIIRGIGDTNFDRAHFSAYGDFSLVFEVVYYVTTSDYLRYMDIQQEINLKLKEAFDDRGVEFAFPTQTLLIDLPVSSWPSRRAGRSTKES